MGRVSILDYGTFCRKNLNQKMSAYTPLRSLIIGRSYGTVPLSGFAANIGKWVILPHSAAFSLLGSNKAKAGILCKNIIKLYRYFVNSLARGNLLEYRFSSRYFV
jgi:hypothetical protein